ncbi:T9SS type A sorting domain-containing protein [Psychroflexus sediminis]|uniref:Por secretion system C-terminal sorting domain-containing protein n=1 Tax=Psychroflexus sediminis TaxID=470826 RepID=A0A1G7TZH8_9FLAO|nr:T9SS type A sorting domain-containing protein [Psychroflexus sediminis]SDG40686.1 Por secretion system C-terminal sorting domain-containing protein [Psychroflexus sediminis]
MKTYLLLLNFIFVSNALWSQVFVAENATINLINEVDLSVAGELNNNGHIVGTGFIQLVGDKSQLIYGNGELEKFSLRKTSGQAEIASGNQDVLRLFEIHGGTFLPKANLTLKSVDTLTAQMGQNTGGTITGDIISERYIPKSNRAFRYISSPVSTSNSIRYNLQEGQNNTGTNYPADNLNDSIGYGTHITGSKNGSKGFDATSTGNASFFDWIESSQSWMATDNTDTRTLDKGESFAVLIRGSRETSLNSNTAVGPETTLRLTGNPTILNFTKQIDLIEDNSFVLLGNPYHSIIDANLVLQNNTGLNNNFIYVYDPTLNTRGAYAIVELPGGSNGQGSEANQFIQAWQAAFVEATNTGATTLNLSFSENDKNVSQPQVQTFSLNSRINLKLQKDSETIDGLSLKLKHGANSEVDLNDAKKFWNYDESLSIYSQGKYLSIEERDFLQAGDTVEIYLHQKRQDHYKLVMNSTGLSSSDIVLKDFYLDKSYPLKESENLTVDYLVAEGEPELRFGFIIESETLSDAEFVSENFIIYPNPAKDVLNIAALNSQNKKLNFEIYSLLGQKVSQGDFEDKITNYNISSLSTGVYLIVITDNKHIKETLKFIKN